MHFMKEEIQRGYTAHPLWVGLGPNLQAQTCLASACADPKVLNHMRCHMTRAGDFCLHQLYCQFIMMHQLCTGIQKTFQLLYLCFTKSNLCTSSWITVSVTQ